MNVGDLREIINDPDIPDDTPVRIQTAYHRSTWDWQLDGAFGRLAGKDPHIVLQLGMPSLQELEENG